jgi:predicted SnoaL-like aldol condensation-catalyzing enzyme
MTTRDDAAEISELFSRYYTAVDTADAEGWLRLWAPNGVYDSGHQRAEGPAQLRAFISGHVVHTRHLVTNVFADVSGETAVASNYMVVLPTSGTPDVIATAHCRSELAKVQGRWLLTRHQYEPDVSFLPPGVGAPVAHEAQRTQPEVAERNKRLLKVLTLELWTARNEGAIDRFFSEDYVQHSPFAKPGRQGVHDFFRAVTAAIPDLAVTLDHLFAEGDRVFAFMTWKGTQRGELFGAPATQGPVTLKTAELHRLEQGRIVEHWDVVDASGMAPRR